MTDLETACRELVESLESDAEKLPELADREFAKGMAEGWRQAAHELECVVDDHTELDPDVKHLVEQMEDAT